MESVSAAEHEGGELRNPPVLKEAVRTHVGLRRRDNQDAYGYVRNARSALYVVADGMGGASGGALASAIAVHVVTRLAFDENGDISRDRLQHAVERANDLIHSYSRSDESLFGMGTTLVALAVNEKSATIAHVGDSRVYHYRDGDLRKLTRDHTLVQELVKSGAISDADAENHPIAHMLTRSLGPVPAVEVEVVDLAGGLEAQDKFLLCCDGLYNHLSHEEMRILIESGSPEQAADRLVTLALDRGGSDNITVIVVEVDERGAGASEAEGESDEQRSEVSSEVLPWVLEQLYDQPGSRENGHAGGQGQVVPMRPGAVPAAMPPSTRGTPWVEQSLAVGLCALIAGLAWGLSRTARTDQRPQAAAVLPQQQVASIPDDSKGARPVGLPRRVLSLNEVKTAAELPPRFLSPEALERIKLTGEIPKVDLTEKLPQLPTADSGTADDDVQSIDWNLESDDARAYVSGASRASASAPAYLSEDETRSVVQKKIRLRYRIRESEYKIRLLNIRNETQVADELARLDSMLARIGSARDSLSRFVSTAEREQDVWMRRGKLLNDGGEDLTSLAREVGIFDEPTRQVNDDLEQESERLLVRLDEANGGPGSPSELLAHQERLSALRRELRAVLEKAIVSRLDKLDGELRLARLRLEDLEREEAFVNQCIGMLRAYRPLSREREKMLRTTFRQRRREAIEQLDGLERTLPASAERKFLEARGGLGSVETAPS